jgi:hypothetical protein
MRSLLAHVHLRVARPTNDLLSVLRFYRDGLGFDTLSEFKDHDGFDGVMLGHDGVDYHLEFTLKKGHDAGKAPTQENLLVFYFPEKSSWSVAVRRMIVNGYEPVPAFNPYWDRQGITFEDPDGYRVVFFNGSWGTPRLLPQVGSSLG